ncbi:MAG: ASKHA domain-containing protein [Dorea sp.]|nr:ASKHA domain-containing protein [Dorea sp.]
MAKETITIELLMAGQCLSVTARNGENLLDLLRREQLFVPADCSGKGTCGKCKVKISEKEKRTFQEVLSCRTEIFYGMLVELPDSWLLWKDTDPLPTTVSSDSSSSAYGSSASVMETAKDFQSVSESAVPDYGIAVDLGTSTIAARLLRLSDGQVLASCQEWNQQIPYGGDVISRIQVCLQDPQGLEKLSGLIQEQIRRMACHLVELAGLNDPDFSWSQLVLMISGNTVMQHLYAGIHPGSMACAPYRPATLFTEDTYLSNLLPPTYLTPCISAFIGGDITAGLSACGLDKKEGNWLFLDIGTNGEMVLGGKAGFLCASVATGPAFEGAQIRCGCYGRPGAISHVSWDLLGQKLKLEVLGPAVLEQADITPLNINGICGSGLIDLMAILSDFGLLTSEGRILSPLELEEGIEAGLIDEDLIGALEHQLGTDFLQEDEDGNGIFYLHEDPEHPVYLCTSDVRNLQLAKASVRAGVEVLLKEKALSPADLSGVILAGGFGAHLKLSSVEKIGMLPGGICDKVMQPGNTSLQGAEKWLCQGDGRRFEELLHLSSLCQYLELADQKDFSDLFINYLSIS